MKRETGGKASMMDLLERKLDRTSEQVITDQGITKQDIPEQSIPEQDISKQSTTEHVITGEVISSQVVSQDTNLNLNKSTTSQVVNSTLVQESVRVAYRERPRVSFWSPRVSAIMYYLKKTVPDFSKSEEVETLLEKALARKYPELFKLVSEEMEKGN